MSNNEPMYIDVEKVIFSKSPYWAKHAPKFLINYLKKIIHQDEINELLSKYHGTQGVEFATNTLKYLNVNYNVHNTTKVNGNRRYIFVSNHPLGGFDGIVLLSYIGSIYPKLKFVVNDLLMHIEPLKPLFVPVNKLGKMNQEYVKQIKETYSSDSQILYFPAGLCSRLIKGKVQDLEWKKSFLKNAIKYDRDIIPIFFSGHNSKFFYRLAKLRKFLGIKFNIEMMYLPNEMFKQKNSTFDIYFGDPIPVSTFTKEHSIEEWIQYIRDKAYGTYNTTR
ncbi:MAG: 1-acyl-sn-glycerol-3-phosphate acyltransferase [Bacteroidales bacterium]|nr:1-acyl-sn-glycerol-3-phosphate acyltransferase [Bacteroidales bacterium]